MECLTPKGISNPKTGKSMAVRCGKCPSCQKFTASQWNIRLIEQEKCTKNNYFITLTLTDDNITWGFDSPTLSKRDIQLFLKLLRKRISPQKVKYFAVGEYGETTKRPHYHLLIFDTGIDSPKVLQNVIYTSWIDKNDESKGFCHVGDVTPDSIRYVSGYMEKDQNGEILSEKVQREFRLMSKGIGENYLINSKNYHLSNEKFTYKIGKVDAPLPRYYRDRIFSEQQREAYAARVVESIPKRSPTEEKNHREALANRISSIKKLKTKRK
ncbi:MAG: replication initiator protein [Microviridae sp.]|nr:MAG: replication initiator protein [Microviridae sp.]